jgi:hypothetical protein
MTDLTQEAPRTMSQNFRLLCSGVAITLLVTTLDAAGQPSALTGGCFAWDVPNGGQGNGNGNGNRGNNNGNGNSGNGNGNGNAGNNNGNRNSANCVGNGYRSDGNDNDIVGRATGQFQPQIPKWWNNAPWARTWKDE